MSHITAAQRGRCHAIIHAASVSAGAVGAGWAQVPCSDNAVITPIQIAMVMGLGWVFGMELSNSAAQASLATFVTASIGRGASQLLLGWIPLAGNVVNYCTAALLTEAVGWTLAEEFARQAMRYEAAENGR